jgi:CheY-like chemotaxis protein
MGADVRRVVLVVEDDALLLYSLARALRSDGLVVLEATSGEQAMLHLNALERVDVVLTDIHLAGTASGWDVAEAFRSSRGDVAVIYTSGDAPDRTRAVNGSHFFEKPYDTDQVVNACRRYAR